MIINLKGFSPSRQAVIAIILIALAAIVWGIYAYAPHSSKTTATASAKQVVPPPTATPVSKPAAPAPVDKSICVVKAGEGIEHALIRQLMADPSIAQFQGDANDKTALKQWAGHKAHVLALKAGYIGKKFGEEIRVRLPNTMVYVIEKDPVSGNIQIVEYSAVQVATSATPGTPNNGIPNFMQISSHAIATTMATAHFIGPQDGTTVLPNPYRSYEYMYVG
jgi:hypothetical protein